MKTNAMSRANRLVNEKSPYLLQHAYNPVDWYPWGEEAFAKAEKENKPIFLSIGYSTCHWCHVMEKDSFEDQEVADLLNKNFISIKVDREERPDLDQQYMAACQALTGQGGWPLTVFLTPAKKPFYAATFIPKSARYGMNGMIDILPRLSAFWKEDSQRVVIAGDELIEAMRKLSGTDLNAGSGAAAGRELPGEELLHSAYGHLKGSYDQSYGGFGDAPKFPAPHQLLFLLRYWKRSGEENALKMAVESLRAMHRGGIFDQLGYGMHRYSVDQEWLVPHFEKMLYDQALTAISALEAYRVTGDQEMALFARRIFSYLLTDLLSPDGAFYSAEDADSEGEEGTFYVWRPEELKAALGEERGHLVAEYFGVSEKGNFEHSTSILHRRQSDEAFAAEHGFSMTELQILLEEARAVLLTKRALRERPFRDDKIITAWNGLAIAALARGAIVLEEPSYLAAAERATAFIAENMVSVEGRLRRRYREGEAAIPAFLDDYANLAWAHLELYKSGAGESYLESAERLSREMLTFFEGENGILRYSATAVDSADFALEAEAYDGATPSGVSVAAMNLQQLGRALQDETLSRKGEGLIIAQQAKIERYPTGFTYLLTALDYALSASEERFYCTENGCCGLE